MLHQEKPALSLPFDCLHCGARGHGLCRDCGPDGLFDMDRSNSGRVRFARGVDILRQGGPSGTIYNLVEGWVHLYQIVEDGRRQILHFAMPGAILGYESLFSDVCMVAAQALTDVVACAISPAQLSRLTRKHPELMVRLSQLLSRDRSLAFDHLTSIGRQTARRRVARLLLELFIRYRHHWPGHNIEEMRLPLSQEHIGDATGLTGVHVNRVLRELKDARILEFHYRRLTILNPDLLIEEAGLEPHALRGWTNP